MKNLRKSIRVSLTDDHTIVRSGLNSLLQLLHFTVEFETANGTQLIETLQQADLRPDICLLDINMRGMDGWQTLREIRERWPSQKVIFMTVHDATDTAVRAFMEGVNGYLDKNCGSDSLAETLLRVHNEGLYVPDAYSKSLLQAQKEKGLTDREYEFLHYFSNDLPSQEIARRMRVSIRTVDGYRDALMRKLNVNTKYGLISYAFRCGVVSL